MAPSEQFHDGSFDGLWINGKTVHLFLRTEAGRSYTLVAEVVDATKIGMFKEGNIIRHIAERSASEITLAEVIEIYDLSTLAVNALQNEQLLARTRESGLRLLELATSYGAEAQIVPVRSN